MNNEPVAWMMKAREPSLHCPDYVTFETPTRDMKISHHPYPLYTHPADLTDEEIKTLKEIIRITDRKHDLWDKAKEFLK